MARASLEMRRAVREAGQLASGEDLHNLAAVLMSQDMSSDEVVECEALLRRAEERAANPLARARSLVNLGWLLARSAGAQELERTFRRAAEVGDPLGLLNLGLYLCRGDSMDEAATCFVRAAEKKAPFAWQYCALLTEVVESTRESARNFSRQDSFLCSTVRCGNTHSVSLARRGAPRASRNCQVFSRPRRLPL